MTETTTDATPRAVPTGWTPEQLDALNPALADAVDRLVRECDGYGVRLRPAGTEARPDAVFVQILDEAGRRAQLTAFHEVTVPRLVEPFGLCATVDCKAWMITLSIAVVASAAVELATPTDDAPRARRMRRGGDE